MHNKWRSYTPELIKELSQVQEELFHVNLQLMMLLGIIILTEKE